jgi:hypothetical protein
MENWQPSMPACPNYAAFWTTSSNSHLRIRYKVGAKFACLLSATQWKSFWQSVIPHQARTIWWRLLHDKIPYRIRLPTMQSDKLLSAECPICLSDMEDDFHMLVNCSLTWSVWQKAIKEFSLESALRSPQQVWMCLLLDKSVLTELQGRMLPLVDHILSCIWKLHWKCVFDGAVWSSEACLTSIRNQRYGQLAAQYDLRVIDYLIAM